VVELEENIRRKDLSAYERSKLLTDLADTARAVAREEDETCAECAQVSKPARGPSKGNGSSRSVAERIGVPEPTIRKAKQHVAAVERHPQSRRRRVGLGAPCRPE
jgi:hypothetical protein